jgi:2-polyprenyl-6-methoxyphenol hydroxylase-like FAD-dependent oxidoreductase
MSEATEARTTCCIAGGGPAGMMLGFLLARAGIDVIVLEKHKDFLRDFRGDTIHPSTLELMHELGLLQRFLALPHQEARYLGGVIGDEHVRIADFTHLPTKCRFVAFMPQWDFLDFMAGEARAHPAFSLRMETEAVDIIEEEGRIAGVRARDRHGGELRIRAGLVVGADGRHSTIRRAAGLEVEDIGAPIDVLWMRLTRRPSDGAEALGRVKAGCIFVMIDRGDYWQCALVIAKGGFEEVKRRGMEALRNTIAEIAPALKDRVEQLRDWRDVSLLTVTVDRLKRWWRPGLICVGDAAHAMSPVGGVGINLAIQDAVAAANILAEPLRTGSLRNDNLQAIQDRRMFPTRATQALQVVIQNRILSRVLAAKAPLSPPWPIKLLSRVPILQRIPARIVGMGFRPEHIRWGALDLPRSLRGRG